MSSFTMCSSDEEILKALSAAVDIRNELVSNSASEIECTIPFQASDFDLEKETYETFKFDPEFQAVSQNIEELYLMNDLFNEKKKALEAETKAEIKGAMLFADEILSESILDQRLHSINLIVKHIKAIVNQMSRIKQVLQEEQKNTMKVSPSCQEAVIQFFKMADAIIKEMQKDTDFIENSDLNNIRKVIPMNENSLHFKLQTIIEVIARRIDILTEFRSYLSRAEDLESGIELGISELSKSDHPRVQADQISSTDSGLC